MGSSVMSPWPALNLNQELPTVTLPFLGKIIASHKFTCGGVGVGILVSKILLEKDQGDSIVLESGDCSLDSYLNKSLLSQGLLIRACLRARA